MITLLVDKNTFVVDKLASITVTWWVMITLTNNVDLRSIDIICYCGGRVIAILGCRHFDVN